MSGRKRRQSHRTTYRAREAAGRRIKWISYALLSVICLVLVAPPLVDRALGAVSSSGDCRLLRVISGDTFRVSCPPEGRMTVHLLGADTPSAQGVGCVEELTAGLRAKWAARQALWSAGEVHFMLDGMAFGDRTLVQIRAGDTGLARHLVEGGHGRYDVGMSDAPWCDTLQESAG